MKELIQKMFRNQLRLNELRGESLIGPDEIRLEETQHELRMQLQKESKLPDEDMEVWLSIMGVPPTRKRVKVQFMTVVLDANTIAQLGLKVAS